MNPLLVIGLLSMFRKGRSAKSLWPTVRHHPPVSLPAAPAMPSAPAAPAMPEHPATHATPADHAASEHLVAPATHHASPAEHAAHEVPESAMHEGVAAPQVLPAARVVHRRRRRRRRVVLAPRVTTLPAQVIPVPTAGVVTVSSAQAILRGLGWTGHLTTKGSVIPELRDGLFGQITVDDWTQSANKRGLDPTIERIDGTTVQVNPDTYAALTQVARSKGAVVGIYIP